MVYIIHQLVLNVKMFLKFCPLFPAKSPYVDNKIPLPKGLSVFVRPLHSGSDKLSHFCSANLFHTILHDISGSVAFIEYHVDCILDRIRFR